jgi:hypothetical protein
VLSNVSYEDEGWYTCIAGNSLGMTYASAYLHVVDSKLSRCVFKCCFYCFLSCNISISLSLFAHTFAHTTYQKTEGYGPSGSKHYQNSIPHNFQLNEF